MAARQIALPVARVALYSDSPRITPPRQSKRVTKRQRKAFSQRAIGRAEVNPTLHTISKQACYAISDEPVAMPEPSTIVLLLTQVSLAVGKAA